MKRSHAQFVVCVKNKGYTASLELSKLYRSLSDGAAAEVRLVRVIDESGEDYLYPREYFVPVQVPESAKRAVRRVTSPNR